MKVDEKEKLKDKSEIFNYNLPKIEPYNPNKPINIVFDKNFEQLQSGSNVPWVTFDNKKNVLNPMILSNCLKTQNLKGEKIFNYIIVKGNDSSNKYKIFVYSNGVYVEMSSDEFKAAIRKFIPQLLRNKRVVDEVYSDLICNDMFVPEENINCDENIINFKDGIFNIKTKKLLPHNPKYLSTIQIPTNFKDVQNAPDDCPVFNNYIEKLCNYNENLIEVIMQCMGLCLSNIYGYRTKKALFLVGDGDTGKSQIKKLIETLLGKKNISTIGMKELNDRFGKEALYGKRLVGSNDMSYQHIEDMNIFKQATGGDSISIEFKYGSRINYTYKGFLWFNCNDLPSFGGDKGEWVYNRILPIACLNVIPKEKQDKNLFEKMYKEKNTIIKKALQALYRLIDNNYIIDRTPEMDEILKQYEDDNNTLLTFIKEYCEDASNMTIKTKRSTFYAAYDVFCKTYNQGKGKLGNKAVKQILKKKFNEDFHKSNGIWYMTKLCILPDTLNKEFKIFKNSETPLY